MAIRLATQADFPEMERVFAHARQAMREGGNPTQWGDHYPEREILEGDLARDTLYVMEDDATKTIYAVFVFALGDDATYELIEDGAWLDDEPYGTIHRIASDGTHRGIFSQAMEFCRTICPNIRIDTHADNVPMRRGIEREGFVYCGIIYHTDGTPRVAYQLPPELR